MAARRHPQRGVRVRGAGPRAPADSGATAPDAVSGQSQEEESAVPGLDDITEKASDAGIDKAADAADQKSGGKLDGQVDKAQESADQKIGE